VKLVFVVTLFGHKEQASVDLPFEPTEAEQEWLAIELHRRLLKLIFTSIDASAEQKS
jgi:hypothetical protein